MTKTLKIEEVSDVEIAESSYFIADVIDANFLTKVTEFCLHFSLVINVRNRERQWKIFAVLSKFCNGLPHCHCYPRKPITPNLNTWGCDNADIRKQICLLKMYDWRRNVSKNLTRTKNNFPRPLKITCSNCINFEKCSPRPMQKCLLAFN